MAFFLRSIFLRKLYNFREIIFEERRLFDNLLNMSIIKLLKVEPWRKDVKKIRSMFASGPGP